MGLIDILNANHANAKDILSVKTKHIIDGDCPLGNLTTNPRIKACGCQDTVHDYLFTAVIYQASHLTMYEADNCDIVSFDFSGCYMASFTMSGHRYGCHIACDGSPITKTTWNDLVTTGTITNVILFKPTKFFSTPKIRGRWGIITTEEQCFAIDTDESRDSYNQDATEVISCTATTIIHEAAPLTGPDALIPVPAPKIPHEPSCCVVA